MKKIRARILSRNVPVVEREIGYDIIEEIEILRADLQEQLHDIFNEIKLLKREVLLIHQIKTSKN